MPDETPHPPPLGRTSPRHGWCDVVLIRNEHDARRARLLARRMAEEAGAGKLVALRAAAALGEFARNILAYAESGEVVVEIIDPPGRIRIVARDEGGGIPQIEDVLSTHGTGLASARKFAAVFQVNSSAAGTTIIFEMPLADP